MKSSDLHIKDKNLCINNQPSPNRLPWPRTGSVPAAEAFTELQMKSRQSSEISLIVISQKGSSEICCYFTGMEL